MRGMGWLGFLPQEAILPMIAIAGLLMAIGLVRYALILLVVGFSLAIAPAILEPVFSVLPPWALILLMIFGLYTLIPKRKKKKR